MRKLFVTQFMTLDGVMEAPGGEPGHPHTGWVFDFMGEQQQQWKLKETQDTETLLIGRVTYESFFGAWPEREGPFAEKMNSMEKVVVSSTLTDPEWNNTTVLTGDIIDGVKNLKLGEGGPIQVPGSNSLVHLLLENGLVDELVLMTFPVTVGSGLKVFPDNESKTEWSLGESETFDSGVRVDTYRSITG